MNKKQISSLSCFTSSKIESNKHTDGYKFNCVNSNKKPMSKSLHDNINYLDSSSLHSSNSSGQNILTLRPKPPPYDEYASKKYGITRSHSTYSACHDSICQDNRSIIAEPIDVQDDLFSQYSEGDPPRLTDHLSKLSISRYCVRPITLRPISPPIKTSHRHALSFSKSGTDSQQSPSGDSGVRLTPNDLDQNVRSREFELHNNLQMPTDNERTEELKLLRLVNNKLSLSELNNQHLITKATHLIGKLRQKLKDKDFEINNLQNKLNDNTERLRYKESKCKDLELEYQQSCLKSKEILTTVPGVDVSTETLPYLDQDNVAFQILTQQMENERAQWLEEKALVISYHKQLNERYHSLLQKNTHLENELQRLQGRYISDFDCSSDTYTESENGENTERSNIDQKTALSNTTNKVVSRLVKFEESLC